ncbi:unnamed protein product [Sphagnum jensenii]
MEDCCSDALGDLMLPWPSMDMKSSLQFEADPGQPQTSSKQFIRQGSKKSAGIQPDYHPARWLPVSANTQPGGTEAALPSKLLDLLAT